MSETSAVLARAITRAGSKQTYYTARMMVDRDLVSDFCRAYAYFRWVDDVVDESSLTQDEVISFIGRQRQLIERLYSGERVEDLTAEELMLADLISHDRGSNGGLHSFVWNMFLVIEFDAHRRGRLVSQKELAWYSDCLGRAVTDGIQYFIGNGHAYLESESRYLAATGAHIAHLLRDTLSDAAQGYYNIPREYLAEHDIKPADVGTQAHREWVRSRVALARQYFADGKRYLDDLNVLRCRIVGHWYCARFDGVLDAIERDGYVLRSSYTERRSLSSLLRMLRLTASVTLRHALSMPLADES